MQYKTAGTDLQDHTHPIETMLKGCIMYAYHVFSVQCCEISRVVSCDVWPASPSPEGTPCLLPSLLFLLCVDPFFNNWPACMDGRQHIIPNLTKLTSSGQMHVTVRQGQGYQLKLLSQSRSTLTSSLCSPPSPPFLSSARPPPLMAALCLSLSSEGRQPSSLNWKSGLYLYVHRHTQMHTNACKLTHRTHTERDTERIHVTCMTNTCTDRHTYVRTYTTRRHMKHTVFMHPLPLPIPPHKPIVSHTPPHLLAVSAGNPILRSPL